MGRIKRIRLCHQEGNCCCRNATVSKTPADDYDTVRGNSNQQVFLHMSTSRPSLYSIQRTNHCYSKGNELVRASLEEHEDVVFRMEGLHVGLNFWAGGYLDRSWIVCTKFILFCMEEQHTTEHPIAYGALWRIYREKTYEDVDVVNVVEAFRTHGENITSNNVRHK